MDIERSLGDWLAGSDSGVARDIARRDWSDTPIGQMESWPADLRAILATVLACPTPMYLAWGPELISFYNDAYEPILGYRAKDALGKPFRDLWASIWDDISPLVDRCLAGESQKMVDMRLDLSRNGLPEESYWTFTYSPVIDANGGIAGLICVTGETTDRILAERARAKATERLELAMSSSNSVGIWDWDVIADRLTADSNFANLYGVDPNIAAEGTRVEEFIKGIHPEDRPRVQAEIARTIAAVGKFSSEYRLLGRDGTVSWVSAQGQCMAGPDGRCVRMPGVSYDITRLKEAELQLRAAKEEREFVLEQIARQRTQSDPQEILRASSEALGKRLGVNRVGFYRMIEPRRVRHEASWSDGTLEPLTGSQTTDHYGQHADAERRAGRALVFGDSRQDCDGKLKPYAQEGVLAGICVPLLTSGKWAAGIYLHQADVRIWTEPEIILAKEIVQQTWLAIERAEALISLSRRVEEQEAALQQREIVLREEFERREAAERQLRQLQKMEAVGQLTGGIAHDFNNMLAVVISGLNLTQRQLARGNADVGAYIEGALDGAGRAAALTQRLLAFSRQQPLEPAVIDANAQVIGLSDMLSRSLGETIVLDTHLQPDLWATKVDRNQLENAIINLAVNARDAMPDGGQVTLETANADLAPAEARELGIEPGAYVRIRVLDTGTGMTPEVLAKAFDPFFTTKPTGRGTGLGLSQVYGFIRQSGGHVTITSQVDQGTAVDLYLPRSLDHAARTADDLANDVPLGQPAQVILVVEDEDRVRAFTVASLRDLGYTVLEASSGPAALDILSRRRDVSLLFTDVVMPQMTGPQLVEQARRLRDDLKVVYASGYTGDSSDIDTRVKAGGNFLAKPFSFDQLARKIAAALG
ncbi:PAS domain-containing protein [Paracoccus sp. WLY502]|uniref:PAS domain-containing protein n=1 Tax=Paracoccus yibinensis TaxID=3068891 RepID=UPI00279691D5|nr:PAS domain-containing protein [Paracoccus sp. WLY502]MDQ1899596.1 PAS domain-containing protein [Paracoccus sp. WLY502]